jgi:hypothetical protein
MLTIDPNSFSNINDQNKRVILPGKFEIAVGGVQPGAENWNGLKGEVDIK